MFLGGGEPEKKKSRWSDEPAAAAVAPQVPVQVSFGIPLQNQGPVPPGANPQLVQVLSWSSHKLRHIRKKRVGGSFPTHLQGVN